MSGRSAEKSITVPDQRCMKSRPQFWLIAYTTPMALRLDPYCDAHLVCDFFGMVF